MYKVVLVDDEIPAVRFVQAIIEKYTPDYTVVASFSNGESALGYLKQHKVDLLLTDINMAKMDGIELATRARALDADLRIVIISGYAEFEYAKGAIQANVDDYLLKPVSITHMKEILGRIKDKLDEANAVREPALLGALLSGQAYDKALFEQLYGGSKYHFALIRWGNLQLSQGGLYTTSILPMKEAPFTILYGRDDDEQLLFMKADAPAGDFQSAVKVYMTKRQSVTWHIIFSLGAESLLGLPAFFTLAAQQMERTLVIGRRHFAYLTRGAQSGDVPHLPNATVKRLELFVQDGNMKMVKEIFISLAVDWEKRQVPQVYAAIMVHQLIHFILTIKTSLIAQQDQIMREVSELVRFSASYGDLLSGIYATLFDDNSLKDKKLTAKDLYNYAIRYIQEKYAQPISIQHVCSEVGISQTYLSRLFRKYGNTSFTIYLTKYRMDNAMALIREHPDLPLRHIASCVGYGDYAYFSKVFHQVVGCTPSQWLERKDLK